MAKTISLDEVTKEIISRSVITENSLQLPPDQLERKVYDAVNKVLVAAGGKWNKKLRVHVFESDPRQLLGLAVEQGAITNLKQEFQEFFTPADVAQNLCDHIAIGDRVLEPSAGIGRIAKAAADAGAKVFCCEIQGRHVAELRKDDRLTSWEGDFLKFDPTWLRPFDHVVMNPPFSEGQEYAHIMHAAKFLKRGGTLTSIMSPAMKWRGQKSDMQFRDWLRLETIRFDDWEMPEGTFKSEGTNVKTICVKIWT